MIFFKSQQVGDPAICTKISDDLIVKYGHYVQVFIILFSDKMYRFSMFK